MKTLAHARPVRWLIAQVFKQMSFVIPARRLRESDTLLAFFHPRPSHRFHVILVPKDEIASLADLDPHDTDLLSELYGTVQSLIAEYRLSAYRLIVNGGDYQDFPHLHFHLISDVVPSSSVNDPQ